MHRIVTETDLTDHLRALTEAHPIFQAIADDAGPVALRWLDPGFAGLVWVITGQQISVAAGRAIYSRLEAKLDAVTAGGVQSLSDETLREVGFSGAKVRTIRAIQYSILDGGLDLPSLHEVSADDAITALTEIKGIGPWTAEVYLLFAVGHPDIFPAADVALQEAAKMAFGAEVRPTTKELKAMAEAWSPSRSAAARLLWTYYRTKRGGKSSLPV